MIRLLTVEEIASIAAVAPFELCARSMVETMDYRPIDAATGRAESVWADAVRQNPVGFPTLGFRGELKHPPVPEPIRKYYPEDKRDGWTQSVGFDVQGATDGSTCFLFLTSLKDPTAIAGATPCAPRLYGWTPGSTELASRRGLEVGAVDAVSEALPALAAQMQAVDIGAVSPDPQRSGGPKAL